MPLEIAKALITQVSLAHYTEPELIFPRLAERDSPGIIAELSRGLQRQGVIQDVLPFYQNHTTLLTPASLPRLYILTT